MKCFLLFLVSFSAYGQRLLKAGVYKSLKTTEPIVLDTGTFTFIGLEMSCIVPPSGARGPELVWLDGRKAKQLILFNCVFEGTGKEIAILNSGDLRVSNCSFENMGEGILQTSPPESLRKIEIRHNLFKDNITSIHLILDSEKDLNVLNNQISSPAAYTNSSRFHAGIGLKSKADANTVLNLNTFTNLEKGIVNNMEAGSAKSEIKGNIFTELGKSIDLIRQGNTGTASLDFTLKCNQFKLSCTETNATACDNQRQRKCLVIGGGVRVNAPDVGITYQNQIGGEGAYNSTNPLVAHPNANEWPVKYDSNPLFRGTFPTSVSGDIQALDGWEGPLNWKSLENNNSQLVTYHRYKNEFVRSIAQELNPLLTQPATTMVKTIGTPVISGVTYENACDNLIVDNHPIFPARIAVVIDSAQSITTISSKKDIGSWLGNASPNPAGKTTIVECFIPEKEELALLQFVEISTGRVLNTKTLKERGKLRIEIDLGQFAAGVYGYQVILQNEKLGAKRFVVIK